MSIVKNFVNPDVEKEVPNCCVKLCNLNSEVSIAKMIVQPGWSWSKCVKPIVKTEWCEAKHIGVLQKGKIGVKMKDGSEFEVKAGDSYIIDSGHDGWVIGDEEVVGYEFNQVFTS